MVCATIKEGEECAFMTSRGCAYNGGCCHKIVEECDGCGRRVEFSSGWFCASSPDPSMKWRNGHCNLATHVSVKSESKKVKINPLKASKRGAR